MNLITEPHHTYTNKQCGSIHSGTSWQKKCVLLREAPVLISEVDLHSKYTTETSETVLIREVPIFQSVL